MNQTYTTVPRYSLKLIKEKSVRYPAEKVQDSSSAEKVLRAYLEDKDCEHMVVLMLDAANNMIGLSTVAVGGVSGLNTGLRDVFKAAIVARASGIILGHNHPSMDCTPSKEDIHFTEKAIEAGKLLSIPVVDHIIISSGFKASTYSFMQNGLLF
jgi:DNA repair protein RadC